MDRFDHLQRPGRAALSFGRALARFLRARDGATAVEMGLVALPFFLLLFGILELGMVFLVSSSLENATAQAARTIRTGQLQNSQATAEAFKGAICERFTWLKAECGSNLSIDVRTFESFQSVTAPQPIQNRQFKPEALAFDPGGPDQIVVVRAYYRWPLVTPMISQALEQLEGGKAVITSTATFRNEPF